MPGNANTTAAGNFGYRSKYISFNKSCDCNQQGSELIDRRLTWREMENLIFGDILEDLWRIFEEFWRNLFVVRSPTEEMVF